VSLHLVEFGTVPSRSTRYKTNDTVQPWLHVQFIACNLLHAINCTCNHGLMETPTSSPVSLLICYGWLCSFGHVAVCWTTSVLRASLRLPLNRRRTHRHLHTTWLRSINAHAHMCNIGIHSAWKKANSRAFWH